MAEPLRRRRASARRHFLRACALRLEWFELRPAPISIAVDRSSFFNYNLFAGSYPDIENYGGFVRFTHKIFGEQMVLYGDLFYQNTTTHNELAAGATGDFQTPGSVTLAIPPSTPNPGGEATPTGLGGPTYAETGVTPGAFNPFNPSIRLSLAAAARASLEFGNRLGDDETDGFMATVGVRGDKLFDGTGVMMPASATATSRKPAHRVKLPPRASIRL